MTEKGMKYFNFIFFDNVEKEKKYKYVIYCKKNIKSYNFQFMSWFLFCSLASGINMSIHESIKFSPKTPIHATADTWEHIQFASKHEY